MKKTLILLQQIKLEELQIDPLEEATKQKIQLFIRQLQLDHYKYSGRSLSKNSLLNIVYQLVQSSPNPIIDADSSTKIDLLRTLNCTNKTEMRQLDVLSEVLADFSEYSLEEIQQKILDNGIKNHVQAINDAMNNTNNLLTAQTLLDFGTFIQEQFPGTNLDDTRKKLKNYVNKYIDQNVPDLNIFGQLSHARILLLQEAATENNLNKIYKYDAIGKAINLYAMIMGEQRIEQQLVEPTMSEAEKAIEPLIASNYRPPLSLKKIILAQNLSIQLRKQDNECINYLTEQIKTEAKQLPEAILSQFTTNNESNMQVGIKVEMLAQAIVDNSDKTKSIVRHANDQLKCAAQSYLVIRELDNELRNAPSTESGLVAYKKKFEEPHIKSALNTNPDDFIKKFIKVAGYLISKTVSLATFGAIPFFAEQSPLSSHQQNLYKETVKNINDAKDQEIFKP